MRVGYSRLSEHCERASQDRLEQKLERQDKTGEHIFIQRTVVVKPCIRFFSNYPGKLPTAMESSPECKKEERERVSFFTPLACLRVLSERGYVFDIEVRELRDESHPEFRDRRWRADVWESREGNLQGTAEAPRKALAKNAALMDLMDKLRQVWPHEDIPMCKIPLGVRISPIIFLSLLSCCRDKKLPSPHISSDLVTVNGTDKFVTEIKIGDLSFSATSFEERYSKLHAALKAYKEISGKLFPLDNVHLGSACLGLDEFYLIECEQTHVVMAKCKISACSNGLQLTKKRTYADSTTAFSLSPILKKIRKGMSEKAVETGINDNYQFRSSSRVSNLSSDLQLTVTTSNISESPFIGLHAKLQPESASQVGSTWPSCSPLPSPDNNASAVVPEENDVDDSFFNSIPLARKKNTALRRLFLPCNSDNFLRHNSQTGASKIISSDVISKAVWTQGRWENAKLEVLKNLTVLENVSDSEDEFENFRGPVKTAFVTSGTGFNEHLFLADYKCALNLQTALKNSVDIQEQLDEI